MTELTGVGAALREAREAQGLAIDDVAQQLKFAPRQIESLEHERFDRLPGPTIARGMVRNYARLLKLEPEPLVARMGPQVEKHTPGPGHIAERFRQGQEMGFSDGAKRSTLIYAGFSIGLLVLVGAVAYEWQQQKAVPEFVAPARERPQAEQPPESAAAKEPPAQTEIVKQLPATASEPPAALAAEKKAEATRAATAATLDKPLAPGMHIIVLRTEAEAWLEVKDASGRMLISSLNPGGSERAVRGRAPFEIVIGNASSVKLSYDGKPVDLRPHIKVEVARFTLQ